MSLTWEILIPTIPHRHDKLISLLGLLESQMQPGVRVVVWRDNLEHSYREKLQRLMDFASADYVSTLADDDSVSQDFVPSVLEAMLRFKADYIGFRVTFTIDGVLQRPVIHSFAQGEWADRQDIIVRDLMYYNPVRREFAQQIRFRGTECDREWANDLREAGLVKTETMIDAELLRYQYSARDNFQVARQPYPDSWIKPLPVYPWLDLIGAT